MMQIKTVIRPISGATQFDNTVNRLLQEGWELRTRKTINTLGDISESFNYPVCQILYAELEKESADTFYEVTL